jgi:hypothetical protein
VRVWRVEARRPVSWGGISREGGGRWRRVAGRVCERGGKAEKMDDDRRIQWWKGEEAPVYMSGSGGGCALAVVRVVRVESGVSDGGGEGARLVTAAFAGASRDGRRDQGPLRRG